MTAFIRGVVWGCVLLLLGGATAAVPAQLPQGPASGAVGPLGPTSAPTTATTAAPRVRELHCRGGGSGLQFRVHQNPSPRVAPYVTMALRYQRSRPAPAGSDWRLALDPGTCSWNAPDGPQEPGEVFFDTEAAAQGTQMRHGAADRSTTAAASAPDTASIPRYLTDPAHFWTFYVYDAGEQVAISHGPWQAAIGDQALGPGLGDALPTTREGAIDPTRAATDELPTSREQPVQRGTSRLGDTASRSTRTDITRRWRLRDLRVVPSLEQVVIRFGGGPTLPSVAVSTEEPIREPSTGRWFFRSPNQLGVRQRRSGSAWEYIARPSAPLARGTRYHYLIDVPAGGAGNPEPEQRTGAFATWTQYARVVFEELDIRNDGDHGVAIDGNDDGEISFLFMGGLGDPSFKWQRLPERDYSTGDRVRLSPAVVLTVEHAPDRFRVLLQGYESDDGAMTPFRTARESEGANPGLYDGVSANANENYAKGEFDLSRIQGRSGRIPFTLRSFPNGNEVSFDVTGYIEVTRQ